VERVTRLMLGCKSFDAAQYTLTGGELMHMLQKGQVEGGVGQVQTPAEQFYALVASSPAHQGSLRHRSKFATHPKRALGCHLVPERKTENRELVELSIRPEMT